MKEKTRDRLITFLLFLPLLLFIGYRIYDYAVQERPSVVEEEKPSLPGVRLILETTEYSKENFFLTYTFENGSEMELYVDPYFRIERQREDGLWEYREDAFYGGPPLGGVFSFSAGESSDPREVSLRQFWPSLREGTYRLAVDYRFRQDRKNLIYCTVYAEITVS